MKKNFGLTVIKQSEVVKEESMAMIFGGNGELAHTNNAMCIVLCKLTFCKPNGKVEPTDTTTTKPSTPSTPSTPKPSTGSKP